GDIRQWHDLRLPPSDIICRHLCVRFSEGLRIGQRQRRAKVWCSTVQLAHGITTLLNQLSCTPLPRGFSLRQHDFRKQYRHSQSVARLDNIIEGESMTRPADTNQRARVEPEVRYVFGSFLARCHVRSVAQ